MRKYLIFGVLGSIAIAADQWSKIVAREVLKPLAPHEVKTVISGFWDMRYSENTGVAFGMLQGAPGGRYLLAVIATAAFLAVVHYLRKTPADETRLHVALALVGGGAIGNLIDRIAFGRVTDFIVWHVGDHEWPAFNV